MSVAFTFGLGKHDTSLTPGQEINVLKWMWLANPTGLMVSILARVSIGILLVRLFGVHKWFKWLVIIVTASATLLTVAIIPCEFLQSDPISGVWDTSDTTAKRWNPYILIHIIFVAQGESISTHFVLSAMRCHIANHKALRS